MKCVTKCPLNSLNVEIEFGVSLLNHTLAGPFKMVGKVLHIISSRTPCKCMRVFNDSKWSSGSCESSYASTYSIQNLAKRGKKVTCAMKGESIRLTSSSKLVDTHLLRAFIIISIFYFIVCISCAMRNTPSSNLEGQLVSYWSCLLTALLSSWSSLSWWSFVGGRLLSHSSLSYLLYWLFGS